MQKNKRVGFRECTLRPVHMVTAYTSHVHSELKNVKKLTILKTKCAPKKVEVNRVYFRIFEMSE